MRSMQQKLGVLGTMSAFAFRHTEIKKNLCRGGRSHRTTFGYRLLASNQATKGYQRRILIRWSGPSQANTIPCNYTSLSTWQSDKNVPNASTFNRFINSSWYGDRMPVDDETFSTRPYQPWGPPSLLYNGHQISFPGVKRPGHGIDHPPPSFARLTL